MAEDEESPCPGPCNSAGDPVWCPPCKRSARVAVADIDQLVTWLEQQADGYASRAPGSYVASRSAGPSGPSSTVDLLDHVYQDLADFERTWRRKRNYAPTRRSQFGRTAHDRAMIIAFISSHLSSVLLDRTMASEVLRLIHWRTVLRKIAHAEPERVARPGRCPACRLVNVLRTDPDTQAIKCSACETIISQAEYEHLVLGWSTPEAIAELLQDLDRPG